MIKPSLRSLFRVRSREVFQKKLENIIGFYPRDYKLYRTALAHKSAYYPLENGLIVNNERLEYLGDAILDAIIAEYLFKRYVNENEGFLTKLRSKIVKRKHLDHLAGILGLQELVALKGINVNYKHIYGNALEALIGAIYLDKGFKKTRKFVIKKIINRYIDLDKLVEEDTDYKSRLIEWGQKQHKSISFETFEKYADRDKNPYFSATVKIDGTILSEGEGRSKKEAEQNAAEKAIDIIEPH